MIGSIQQRLFITALLPLAILAIALVAVNGYERMRDVRTQLQESQAITYDLLRVPAVDALLIGNTQDFTDQIEAVVGQNDQLLCISLRDIDEELVASAGLCEADGEPADVFIVDAQTGGFSDLEASQTREILGTVRVSMNAEVVAAKQILLAAQIAVSLILIFLVALVIHRQLRSRLVEPIRRIDESMQRVSDGDYSTRIGNGSNDEIGRLSRAINDAVSVIQANVAEIERRRDDATRALHHADSATLARDGLVQSLTHDLEAPLAALHTQLTEIAIANDDAELRGPIRGVMQQLQRAQEHCREVIEIATSTPAYSGPEPIALDLADIVADMEVAIDLVAEHANVPVRLIVTQPTMEEARLHRQTGLFISLDVDRLKKLLVQVVRALAKHSTGEGVYINTQLTRRSGNQLSVLVHLRSFFVPDLTAASSEMLRYSTQPPIELRWSTREVRMIEYLLRMLSAGATYSVTASGAVNVTVEFDCAYSMEDTQGYNSAESLIDDEALSISVVTNDKELQRLQMRGELANHDVEVRSMETALSSNGNSNFGPITLIDISDDIASAVTLVEKIQEDTTNDVDLIAICPGGPLTDDLLERLYALGFRSVVQKPVQYQRLLEVIRTSTVNPLLSIQRRGRDTEGPS